MYEYFKIYKPNSIRIIKKMFKKDNKQTLTETESFNEDMNKLLLGVFSLNIDSVFNKLDEELELENEAQLLPSDSITGKHSSSSDLLSHRNSNSTKDDERRTSNESISLHNSTKNENCKNNLDDSQNLNENFNEPNILSDPLGQKTFFNFPNSKNIFHLLSGKLINFLKNFNGSRLLQQSLEFSNSSTHLQIFDEISNYITELMIDPYGNYFCQHFYAILPLKTRLEFLKKILPSIFEISKNAYGNYAIQFLIDHFISQDEVMLIIYPFTNFVILDYTIRDTVAIHVIEKIVVKIPEQFIYYIYDYVVNNFVVLSSNKITLNLIKKIVNNCTTNLTKVRIVNVTCSHFKYLISHPIANNSIQCVLEVK